MRFLQTMRKMFLGSRSIRAGNAMRGDKMPGADFDQRRDDRLVADGPDRARYLFG
jgi:hypothetical protein